MRANGRIFEAAVARVEHRGVRDLYHSALEVHVDGNRFVIEMTPAWGNRQPDRGVLCAGSVGLAKRGLSPLFRYEVRCWQNGTIPDVADAVASPVRVNTDPALTRRLLELVAEFPTAIWGRDELHAGEMWNSHSLIGWLLARSGHEPDTIQPPAHGRAPGWSAGLAVAARQMDTLGCEFVPSGITDKEHLPCREVSCGNRRKTRGTIGGFVSGSRTFLRSNRHESATRGPTTSSRVFASFGVWVRSYQD